MINKEIILNSDGTIKKDFCDRNIPQNSNNQVSVNVLIPSACFTGLQNYAVILGISRIISNVETTLNSLIMTASKSITIDNVLYVKYSAILSVDYTDKIGTLKLSPYIQTTATIDVGGVSTEVISIQQAFTNSNLNVIKSVLPQYDASLETGTTATTLAGQIAGKKIYTFIDNDSASLGQHYYNLVESYDPNASQFKGCIVVSVYDGKTYQYIPYVNDSDVELLEITTDGSLFNISGISFDGVNTYTYTKSQLSYSKAEIDAKDTLLQNQINDMQDGSVEGSLQDQINDLNSAKVDKTQKVNGHALSGDVDVSKSDVGLGNVENYATESVEPTASGSQLYITSKAVYDALQLVYALFNDYTTTTDFNALTSRVEDIETLIGDSDGDDDNIINTLKEVISTLSGLGEDANILSMINSKVSQTDFNTLNAQINDTNGIADKVDILSNLDNAYMEIKAQSGTIDILTTDWEANSDASYPYKWELTNGYLVGATNAIAVFTNDSDTQFLSGTIGIDEVNGKVIIYASQLPSATISIEKIAVFNDLDSYINYSNEVVQDVNNLKTQVNEINNTKLPKCVQSALSSSPYKTYVYNNNDSSSREVGVKYTNYTDANNQTNYEIKADANGITITASKLVSGVETKHEITLDETNGLLYDGNAIGGGGSQLYQHNIPIQNGGAYEFTLTLITRESTAFSNLNALYSYISQNNLKGIYLDAKGTYVDGSTKTICYFKFSTNDGYTIMQFYDTYGGTPKWWYGGNTDVRTYTPIAL